VIPGPHRLGGGLRQLGAEELGCAKGEHQIVHRLPGRVASAWYMDEND
jgi:hypothetical protein